MVTRCQTLASSINPVSTGVAESPDGHGEQGADPHLPSPHGKGTPHRCRSCHWWRQNPDRDRPPVSLPSRQMPVRRVDHREQLLDYRSLWPVTLVVDTVGRVWYPKQGWQPPQDRPGWLRGRGGALCERRSWKSQRVPAQITSCGPRPLNKAYSVIPHKRDSDAEAGFAA